MDIPDDDEPEILYESSKISKAKKRRQRKSNKHDHTVPTPPPIPAPADDNEIEELPIPTRDLRSASRIQRMLSHEDTVILSDSDEEMQDIKPEVTGHFHQDVKEDLDPEDTLAFEVYLIMASAMFV